jgi:hypothetical protein
VATDGTVFVAGARGGCSRVDPFDGAVLDQVGLPPAPRGGLAVAGSRVFILAGHFLSVYDAGGFVPGSLQWTFRGVDGENGHFYLAPGKSIRVAEESTVYTFCGHELCTVENSEQFNGLEGRRRSPQSPVLSPDGATLYVLVGLNDRSLQALTLKGEEEWSVSLDDWHAQTLSIGADETLYLAGAMKAGAFSPEGARKWLVTLPRRAVSAPTVSEDGTVYVGTEGGLVALKDGRIKWVYETPSTVGCPTIGPDETVYATTSDGTLHAIQDPEGNGGLVTTACAKEACDARNSNAQ